jgi:hypothetical protein
MSITTPQNRNIWSLAVAAFAAATLLSTAAARADITLTNRLATTPKHIFTIDDTGLPAQLEIRTIATDMPLALRASTNRPAALLRRIGRGPQLASPIRLEALVDKVTAVAKPDAPAALQKTEEGVEATATWQAGGLKGRLRLVYAAGGSMTGQVTFDPKGVDLERLELVMEFSGPVDTAIAGNPVAAADGKPLPPQFGSLGSDPGMLWCNGGTPAGDGTALKGRIQHFFLGNGDRGFTWLAGPADGFAINDKEPSMSVERNREGVTTWRIAMVNVSPKSGERTAAFTLLTHPARTRAANTRREQWQPWADKPAAPALDAAARMPLSNTLVRADAGSVYEAFANRALLVGPAGGDAQSAAATLADRYPIGLFRYLCAPHTALGAQLRTDAAVLTTPAASPAPDRMAMGRALLHDIGMDVCGLANSVASARVAGALESFGYFSDDGRTEFLPYWRTTGIIRYGEESQAKDGFAVEVEDPTARTRVSAFIRPDGAKRKALFVIVNEGTNEVRGQLYVQQPTYVFGGFNSLYVENIYSQLDFSHIPADSDWASARVLMTVPSLISGNTGANLKKGMNPARVVPPLMDLESGGYVRLVDHGDPTKKYGPAYAVKEFFEVYGPIHVPPRGMRLLYGTGLEHVESSP